LGRRTRRVAAPWMGTSPRMSTPGSESPRLADRERSADGVQPGRHRQDPVEHPSRVPDEKDIRIPDADE
jgi:hypothetical protein